MADNHSGGHQESSMNVKDFEELSLRKLRQCWELASVLNFFSVFEPLLGQELKMSAEEIENALINPNASLAKLHFTLLKGIPPFNKKSMSNPDAWVTILCKKLAEWWPWVAEGEVPLTAAKGEEISRYKELDPMIRLLMLKALCEVRTEQGDLVSYINDALKEGAQISHFRKDKIGQDKNGISYWYDGNSVIGHRLYKEVNKAMLKQKHRGRDRLDLQKTNSAWETLATNLDEFRKVSETLSSSKFGVEAAVHETIETQVIPVLEKLQKKKERDLKRQQREEAFLSGAHTYAAGMTRSCRTRRPVKYTFDDYDRTIDEAIRMTRKKKGQEVDRNNIKRPKRGVRGGGASDGDLQRDAHSVDESPPSTSAEESDQPSERSDSEENDQLGEGGDNDEENEQQREDSEYDEEDGQEGESSENGEGNDLQSEGSDKDEDVNCTNCAGKNVNETGSDSDLRDFELKNGKPDRKNHVKFIPRVQNDNVATSLQMKKSSDCTSDHNVWEARNPEAKNRYRQRPTRNAAFDSSVVPDSDNGSSSENLSCDASGQGDPSELADSEDEISS